MSSDDKKERPKHIPQEKKQVPIREERGSVQDRKINEVTDWDRPRPPKDETKKS